MPHKIGMIRIRLKQMLAYFFSRHIHLNRSSYMRNGFEMYACIVCRFYDRRQRLFHLFVTILLCVSRAHTPNRIAILEILRVAPKPQLTKK